MAFDLKSIFAGRRVLVTGHTGFKGSWLSLWLNELGAEVIGFALPPEYPQSHFELLQLDRHVRHVEGDLREDGAIRRVFDEHQPEFVFHLAAQAIVRRSYDDPKTTFDTNISGSVNLLEAFRESASAKTLVFVTSDKCYLNKEWPWGYRENDELGGHDPYSASKAAAEMVYMAYDHSFFRGRPDKAAASVRAGNVIGGGDWADSRIVPDCIRALRDNKPIRVRNPNATRPWQHVLDPLHGYLCIAAALCTDAEAYRGAWNFGPDLSSGKTVLELAETAARVWGDGEVIVDPPADAPFEHHLLQLNIDKAKLELGWRPTWDSERAILESVNWYAEVLGGASAWEVSREHIRHFSQEIK